MGGTASQTQVRTVTQRVRDLCPVRPADPRVLETIAQLEQMLREGAALTEYAKRVGLSESRLSHLFRANTGWSLGEYAKRVRLVVGRHLLESSLLSIKEVAAEVGADASHFAREFKALFGLSPRKYRSFAGPTTTP